MAKRVIDDSTLIPIADLVRSIMGLSDMLLLTPIDMASHLEDADGVVTNQEALIAELQELLEGKAGMGAGSGSFENTKTTKGTYTPSEMTENLTLEQDFGGFPYALFVTTTGGTIVSGSFIISGIAFVVNSVDGDNITLRRFNVYNNSGTMTVATLGEHTIAKETWNSGYLFTPTATQGSIVFKYRAMTYNWEVLSI